MAGVADRTLTLSWTQARARFRRVVYQSVLALNLAVYAVVGAVAMVSPETVSDLLGLPSASPSGWVRAWAAMLLVATALYVPGALEPVRWRWGNPVGIAGRLGAAVLYLLLGSGFQWLALHEAAFGLLLAFLYFRLFTAELMSRP